MTATDFRTIPQIYSWIAKKNIDLIAKPLYPQISNKGKSGGMLILLSN